MGQQQQLKKTLIIASPAADEPPTKDLSGLVLAFLGWVSLVIGEW